MTKEAKMTDTKRALWRFKRAIEAAYHSRAVYYDGTGQEAKALSARDDDEDALAVLTALAERCEKAEAENAALKAEILALEGTGSRETLRENQEEARAEKVEAELARWKPLIEAVENICAALAYREDASLAESAGKVEDKPTEGGGK